MEEKQEPTFHDTLLPARESESRISLDGGSKKGEIEALYKYLLDNTGKQVTRSSYTNFLRVQDILRKHYDTLQDLIGRGIPREQFLSELLRSLQFLRKAQIVEFLPVLNIKDGTLFCDDHILIQEEQTDTLSTTPFVEKALEYSTDMAGLWFKIHYQQPSDKEFSSKVRMRDPTFIAHFPYYKIKESYSSEWHEPKDNSHTIFKAIAHMKHTFFLKKVYAALCSSRKLEYRTKSEGIKNLGTRFPLAWPTLDESLQVLDGYHTLLRRVFIKDILQSEHADPPAEPSSDNPLCYKNINSEKFQKAYQTFVEEGEPIPGVITAHNMAVRILQEFTPQFLHDEKALAENNFMNFSRNVIMAMSMHSETVIIFEEKREKKKLDELVQSYINSLLTVNPPYVDLNSYVRVDGAAVKDERVKEHIIARLEKSPGIQCLDVVEKTTFGGPKRIKFCFHVDRMKDVFGEARSKARGQKNWTLFLNIERITARMRNPDMMKNQLGAELYQDYLKLKEEYYLYNLPFIKKMMHYLFQFGRKPDRKAVKELLEEKFREEDQKVVGYDQKDQESKIKKEGQKMAREAVRDGERPHDSVSGHSGAPGGALGAGAGAVAGVVAGALGGGGGGSNSGFGADPEDSLSEGGMGSASSSNSVADSAMNNAAADSSSGSEYNSAGDSASGGSAAAGGGVSAASGGPAAAGGGSAASGAGGAASGGSGGGGGTFAGGASGGSGGKAGAGGSGAAGDGEDVKEWEGEVINIGKKVGMDLTEDARLERKRAREEEKKRKKEEKDRKKREEAGKKKKQESLARKPVRMKGRVAPEAAAPKNKVPKHLVWIEMPTNLSVSGKPGRIEFKKKFFKDPEFRAKMADFYRSEGQNAGSPNEKKYYEYLVNSLERNFEQFL